MSKGVEDYFGQAGDMASESQNPAERNDWLEKQQKEQERQRKALERQQWGMTKPGNGLVADPAGHGASTAPPTGMTPATDTGNALSGTGPLKTGLLKTDVPATGLTGKAGPEPGTPKTDLTVRVEDGYTTYGRKWGEPRLIGMFDGLPLPRDWAERPDEWKKERERRAGHIQGLSGDVQDCLYRFNCRTNAGFREKMENDIRKMQEVMPEIKGDAGKPPYGNGGQDASAGTGSPESLREQVARVNLPADQSFQPVFDWLNERARNGLGDNPLWWETPPGHPDMSYRPVGEVLAGSASRGLGVESAIHGNDGTRIAGHADESYDPFIGDVSANMGMDSAVTGYGREAVGAPNLSYWQNWTDEKMRQIPLDLASKGVQQGLKDAQILFFSGASLAGELIHKLVGGDDKALRQIQALLDERLKERENMPHLSIDQLYIDGDPEKTMQNITQYLYQELGNQLVKVPAYYVLGHLKSFMELTGVSTTLLASQIHGDFRQETGGDGKPVESVMVGTDECVVDAVQGAGRQSEAGQGLRRSADGRIRDSQGPAGTGTEYRSPVSGWKRRRLILVYCSLILTVRDKAEHNGQAYPVL